MESEKSKKPTEVAIDEDALPGEVIESRTPQDRGDMGLSQSLSTRHLLMFSVGSSIGLGLWLGSGTSLTDGGPAAIFVGYCIAGSIAWALNQAIGEMAIMYPLPSAFPQWARKFVDVGPAFTVGWAYWFSASITIANELQGVVTVLNFWTDKVPTAAWLSIFLVIILLVNVCAVRVFGEVEVITSAIKLFWIVVIIISSIVISAGGAPNQRKTGFEYWNSMPFTHGFKGFLSVMGTCIFAMGGVEMCGIVAAETRKPQKSVPRAVNSIWLRLSLFYILGALMITITVSPHNQTLFGGSGTNASPFVVAFRDAALPGLAHAMNAVIFISVVSAGNAQAYSGTRTMVGLANIGLAPKIFAKCDRQGRPWASIAITFLIGGGLCYLNVNNSGATVFGWFTNLTSLCILNTWGTIFLSHIRFRWAWKAQGRSADELPWRTRTWPYGSFYGLIWCILLFIDEFYIAVWPLGEKSSAKNFFANYISVVAMLVLYIGTKLYYGGRLWIRAEDIDLDTGRRYYTEDPEDTEATSKSSKYGIQKVVNFVSGSSRV